MQKMSSRGCGSYLSAKLLGSGRLLASLTIAPFLWGLLALNEIIKTEHLPGPPLASNSLTICMYRFIGAGMLGLGVGCLWALFFPCGLDRKAFLTALWYHIKENYLTILLSALFLSIALPAFFVGFDKIGVVMTNVIAVGLVPFAALVFVYASSFLQRLRGLKAFSPKVRATDWTAYALMAFTLFLFLLLTFGTIDISQWPAIAREKQTTLDFQLIPGLVACALYGIFWALYLGSTSGWPSRAAEDIHADRSHRNTLETRYQRLAGVGKPGSLALLEVLLVRVGLVQLLALAFSLLVVLLAQGLFAMPIFPEALADLRSLPQRLPDFLQWERSITLLIVLLLPSFAAYLALNYCTTNYDNKRMATGSAVSSNSWNDLLAFLEPLFASVIGVFLLGHIGKWLGSTENLSEAPLYEFPVIALLVVVVSYFLVFAVKFYGIFQDVFRRDISAYWQKLTKISDDALSQVPGGTENDLLAAGLKDADLDLVNLYAKLDSRLKETMLDYRENNRDRALLYLAFIRNWPFGCTYKAPNETRPAPGKSGLLLRLNDTTFPEALREEILGLGSKNFGSSEEELLAKFHCWFIYLPEYSQYLPVDSHEWREIEKSFYFWLTGSTWFKMKRHRHERIFFHPDSQENLQETVHAITRGFFSLADTKAFAETHRQEVQGKTWQEVLFPLAPHILDTDHIVRGRKGALVQKELSLPDGSSLSVGMDDKVLLLLLPRRESDLAGLAYKNPLWQPLSSTKEEWATELTSELITMVNQSGSIEAQAEFRSRIYQNGFVFGNGMPADRLRRMGEADELTANPPPEDVVPTT